MENYEIEKANKILERAINQLEHILIDIKIAHSKIKIEMFNNCYQFLIQEMEYEKIITELEKELENIRFGRYPTIIDVDITDVKLINNPIA
jgi:predicted nucleic acid-binding protein